MSTVEKEGEELLSILLLLRRQGAVSDARGRTEHAHDDVQHVSRHAAGRGEEAVA